MAHRMAMVNPLLKAEVVEATEFMELAQRFYVYGVPKTVINESVQFEGSVPESTFLNKVMQAAG
jgi:hypothetical protein